MELTDGQIHELAKELGYTVESHQIELIRNSFMDAYYEGTNPESGEPDLRETILGVMDDILKCQTKAELPPSVSGIEWLENCLAWENASLEVSEESRKAAMSKIEKIRAKIDIERAGDSESALTQERANELAEELGYAAPKIEKKGRSK